MRSPAQALSKAVAQHRQTRRFGRGNRRFGDSSFSIPPLWRLCADSVREIGGHRQQEIAQRPARRKTEDDMMLYRQETKPDDPRDRLDVLERRIARMRSLNTNHGDMLALRLIEHAEVERRQLLAEISAVNRKAQ
jgi:hypothetical protein